MTVQISPLSIGGIDAQELAKASLALAARAKGGEFNECPQITSDDVSAMVLAALDKKFRQAGAPNIHLMGLELRERFSPAFVNPYEGRQMEASRGIEMPGLLVSPPLRVPSSIIPKTFKEEVTFYSGPFQINNAIVRRILKRNWWYDVDSRAVGGNLSEKPMHLHPGIMAAALIEEGGYTELRRWLDENGVAQEEEVTYTAGDVNIMPFGVAHEVIDVKAGTRTWFDWAGPLKGWGYMLPNGLIVPSTHVPFDLNALNSLNKDTRLTHGEQKAFVDSQQ